MPDVLKSVRSASALQIAAVLLAALYLFKFLNYHQE